MGCVQAKPSLTSPDRRGIERLKAENEYVGDGRRSSGHAAAAREEEVAGGGERERKMEDDLVDGWPRWLAKNVPRGVLDGLVPKSADSYEMIGKVLKSFDFSR